MTEKRIVYKARKHEPTISEIEKLLEKSDVTIVNAPIDFMEHVVFNFPTYGWRIYVEKDDEAHLSPDVYLQNRDAIRSNYKSVHHIIMERKMENNESPIGWVYIE